MKNKLKKMVVCVIAMAVMFVLPVNAAESDKLSSNGQQEETILLPAGTVSDKDTVYGIGRSGIISTASSEIIDETGGDIGVIIQTLCHVECEEIRNIAILDRLNEDTNTWTELARYDFTAKKEDYPTDELTSLTNAFTIEDQETGYYYRIRGIHTVSTADGSGQTYSTRTSGLLITEYGR